MKTNVFYILMTIIVMGMVIPAFAGSPDKKPGDNTKKENPVVSPTPLTDWTFKIIPLDPTDTCCAYENCNLEFFIQAATDYCEGVLTSPTFTPITIHRPYRSYQGPNVPGDIPCVEVSIIVVGSCICPPPQVNSTIYCVCRGNDCNPRICP